MKNNKELLSSRFPQWFEKLYPNIVLWSDDLIDNEWPDITEGRSVEEFTDEKGYYKLWLLRNIIANFVKAGNPILQCPIIEERLKKIKVPKEWIDKAKRIADEK